MYTFIEILKAIAAILITNSHFGNIWPISSLAAGGMLGDVIFFAVSGFCLYKIKLPFHIWYTKRIIRIYPVVIIITSLSLICGYLKVESATDAVKLFIYPTHYHFIASIMLLYIFFYIIVFLCNKISFAKIEHFIILVFIAELICYLLIFDKSHYHIDVVEDYMAKFLFLNSMLLGGCFRKGIENKDAKTGNITLILILTPVSLVLYLLSSVALRKFEFLSQFQILSHIVVFFTLGMMFAFLMMLETKRKIKTNNFVFKFCKHISKTTLEIYLIQYLVYYLLPEMPFPVNFIITVVAILTASTIVYYVDDFITKKLNSGLSKISDDKKRS